MSLVLLHLQTYPFDYMHDLRTREKCFSEQKADFATGPWRRSSPLKLFDMLISTTWTFIPSPPCSFSLGVFELLLTFFLYKESNALNILYTGQHTDSTLLKNADVIYHTRKY